jgi:hypothetical protein
MLWWLTVVDVRRHDSSEVGDGRCDDGLFPIIRHAMKPEEKHFGRKSWGIWCLVQAVGIC